MAELVAVPERNLHRIPDAIDDRRAIFIEPLAAAFRIAEQITITEGLPIAVIGDGKLGLLCAWTLRASGANLTLVGKHPDKLALAGEGIEPIGLEDAPTLGRAFDVVADCTGSPTGLPTALTLVRPLGTIILKTTIAGEYAINLAPIVIDEITVVGSRCGPFPRAIAALASGEIDPTPLLGPEFPLDQADEAFAAASVKGARKVTIAVE
jgi:threonine dehydrogenase-like Zn-dependent dehydrogenase